MTRRLIRLLVLLTLAAFPLAGQKAPDKIPVSGRVTRPDGAPAADVRVLLIPIPSGFEAGRSELDGRAFPEPAATVKTGAGGAFRLAAEPGVWRIVVEAPGFVPLEQTLVPLTEETELPVARLRPDAKLEVRVTGPGGQPVSGARVRIEGEAPQSRIAAEDWRVPRRVGAAGADGKVLLPRSAGEKLTLRVAALGLAPAERKEVKSGTVSLALAAGRPLRLRMQDAQGKAAPGVLARFRESGWPLGRADETGLLALDAGTGPLDLELVAEDGRIAATTPKPAGPKETEPRAVRLPLLLSLAGKVVSSADGLPVAGALVWSYHDVGRFTRTAADGTYRLSASAEPESTVQAAARGFFEAMGNVRSGAGRERPGPALALDPALRASGVVVDESGRGIAGVEITATLQDRASFRFQPGLSRSGGLARSGDSGRFLLGRLLPGTTYGLRVSKPGFAPGRADLPPREAGQTAPEIRIVLRTGRTAFGRVLDQGNSPVAGAQVALRPAEPTDMMARIREAFDPVAPFEATTDPAGRFELTHLPAGAYDLVVRGRGFAPLTVPTLTIPEGHGSTDLGSVLLAPGVALTGVVADPQGRPLEGAEVRVQSSKETAFFRPLMRDPGPPDAVTGADGSFRLEDRAAGESLDLSASLVGYGPGESPRITVPAEAPVRIVLSPASRVSGRIVGPDEKPVPGARIVLMEMKATSFSGRSTQTPSRFEQTVADDEGAFFFKGVTPGSINLSAMAPRRQTADLQGLEVRAGQELADVEIVLAPAAVIEGRVLAPSGRPVPGAEVIVEEAGENGMPGFSMLRATADGDGFYALDGVPPGPRTLAASAEGYRRTVRDLDVKAGENTLNFDLDTGSEISGRVVDESGVPIAGAQVWLRASVPSPDAPRALTGVDGVFRFPGLSEGSFHLRAVKAGYADSGPGEAVTLAGSSVTGLELKLSPGGEITGHISGLPFDQLARVRVFAGWEGNAGRVDPEGNYRISNLRPDDWEVRATVPDSGLHAEGRVTLEPGAPEARLDLRFGGGFELRGLVTRNGSPLAGASVSLQRVADRLVPPLAATSDNAGAFVLRGLEAGTWEMEVSHANGNTRHEEKLELTGDREVRVDLRTASLAGRVLDASGAGPVAGAKVSLEAPDGRPVFLSDTTSDSRGAFRLSEVSEGAWTLRVAKDGYASAREEVQMDGSPVEDLEVRLQPTEGLTVEALLSSGRPPDRIRAAVFDASGKVVAQGDYPTGENGLTRLGNVPAGSWQILVEAYDSAPVTLSATSPGPVLRTVLPQPGNLQVKVPALADGAVAATATLVSPGGAPLWLLGWEGVKSRWDLRSGSLYLTRVPVGVWQVAVQAADGRTWSGTASVAPGGTAEVTLE